MWEKIFEVIEKCTAFWQVSREHWLNMAYAKAQYQCTLATLKEKWQEFLVWYRKFRIEQEAASGFTADNSIDNLQQPHLIAHIILAAGVFIILIMFLLSIFTVLDEVTVGEGKVIPSSQVQIIQNLEGGIVRKILVKEGQTVQKDQVLMLIDDTRFASTFKEARAKEDTLAIKIARLEAEASGQPFKINPALEKAYSKEIEEAKWLYESRKKEFNQLKSNLSLAERELKLTRPLVTKGAASKAEVLEQERLVSNLSSQLLEFKSKALQELSEARSEYASLHKANQAHQDRWQRTTIKSPVKGIIKVIHINTIGGVVQPGKDIMEIVPLDDTLLIEAKIRPADIGFIHSQQKAIVKISAYEFSVYGGLDAVVEQISADTITDEEDNPFYVIRVRTTKNYLGDKKDEMQIIPGMHATVDIMTGEKTLFDYLMKPILKTRQNHFAKAP